MRLEMRNNLQGLGVSAMIKQTAFWGFFMEDIYSARVSGNGKLQMELLIETLRAKRGNPDWDSFADWVEARSKIKLSRDLVYRFAMGTYKGWPNLRVLIAFSRIPELTFVNTGVHPTMDNLAALLLGELDAYGNPLPQEVASTTP